MDFFGGIEAGGTKFVCAVGSDPNNIAGLIRFDTTLPEETLDRVIEFFHGWHSKKRLAAIGIGSFGPIDLDKKSSTYGYITSTPKPNWANTDIYGKIQNYFDIPVGFNTDVNVAVLGEFKWGAGQCLDNFIYLTIGTGIGGGAMIGGKLLHGISHPEMGHILIPHDGDSDRFEGNCPFHKNCFEGLTSGSAIKERWRKSPDYLAENSEVWELAAKYISYALANYILILSPQRIIIGGGVMNQRNLFPLIHRNLIGLLKDFSNSDQIIKNIEEYIVAPKLGDRSGILGAIALAREEYVKRIQTA